LFASSTVKSGFSFVVFATIFLVSMASFVFLSNLLTSVAISFFVAALLRMSDNEIDPSSPGNFISKSSS
jgi:hypothetical protein